METTLFISDKSNDCVHIVDTIEKYDDTEVVFTKDSKCFNTNDVDFISLYQYYSKTNLLKVSVKNLTDEEIEQFLGDDYNDDVTITKETKKKTFKIFGWTITFSKSK